LDEVSGTLEFFTALYPWFFTWPPQDGASLYLVIRSGDPTFASACAYWSVDGVVLADPLVPAPGAAFFYLVRAAAPYTGSLGRNSAGVERTAACVDE
jgi:hypothetical protein